MVISRRQFLKASAETVAAAVVVDEVLTLTALQPVIEAGNPRSTPRRTWSNTQWRTAWSRHHDSSVL